MRAKYATNIRLAILCARRSYIEPSWLTSLGIMAFRRERYKVEARKVVERMEFERDLYNFHVEEARRKKEQARKRRIRQFHVKKRGAR